MDELEITELKLSEVLEENENFRFDSEFFKKELVLNESLIDSKKHDLFINLTKSIRKGIFDISPDRYREDGIPFLRVQNIKDGFLDLSDCVYISEEDSKKEFKTELDFGDLALSKVGSVGNFSILFQKANTSQNVVSIKVNKEKINPFYLFSFLTSKIGKLSIERIQAVQVQAKLELQDIRKLKIPILPLPFQSHIAELVQTAHAKLEESKKLYGEAEQILLEELGLKFPSSRGGKTEGFDGVDPDSPTNSTSPSFQSGTPLRGELQTNPNSLPQEAGGSRNQTQNFPLEGWPAEPAGVEVNKHTNSQFPSGGVACQRQGGMDPLPEWKKRSLFPFWNLPKNKSLESKAKELRKTGVLSEVLFWKAFNNKKLLGWDIDRQIIIGNYIVDFFIAELGLVVEIDGESHDYKGEYDQERDGFLKSLDLEVLHYQDIEIKKSMDWVSDSFQMAIQKRVEELKKSSLSGFSGLSSTPPSLRSGTPPEVEFVGESNHPASCGGTPPEGNFSNLNISVKNYSESFGDSGRLDAEYYQPKYDEILGKVKRFENDNLGNLVDIFKSIEPGSEAYQDEGIPFVRVSNLNKFEISNPEIKLDPEKFRHIKKPKKDDILLTKDGSVGTAYKCQKDEKFITSGAILHLTLKDTKEVLPDYLALVLNSKVVQLQAERDAGGSIIQHWKPSEIQAVQIPLLPPETQNLISEKIQTSFRLRAESQELLERTKREVEEEIEKS